MTHCTEVNSQRNRNCAVRASEGKASNCLPAGKTPPATHRTGERRFPEQLAVLQAASSGERSDSQGKWRRHRWRFAPRRWAPGRWHSRCQRLFPLWGSSRCRNSRNSSRSPATGSVVAASCGGSRSASKRLRWRASTTLGRTPGSRALSRRGPPQRELVPRESHAAARPRVARSVRLGIVSPVRLSSSQRFPVVVWISTRSGVDEIMRVWKPPRAPGQDSCSRGPGGSRGRSRFRRPGRTAGSRLAEKTRAGSCG